MSEAVADTGSVELANLRDVLALPDLPAAYRDAIESRIDWLGKARWNQLPPTGPWSTWLLLAGRGFGKALALETPVATPTGWTTMGALRDGDTVYDEAGQPTRVVHAHPVQHGRPCWRLRFTGGETVVADEDHLWTTWNGGERRMGLRPKVRTTLEVVRSLLVDGLPDHILPQVTKPGVKEAHPGLRPYGAWVVAAERVESVPVRCITVAGANALFLVGRSMLPTHNTRSGAEWIASRAMFRPNSRIAIVGRSFADVRDTLIEGQSGLLSVIPDSMVSTYNRSILEIVLTNCTRLKGFSADSPDGLRGPEHDTAWCDELCSWTFLRETWDMLQMTMRLGDDPRIIVTTTPKPSKLIREIRNARSTRLTSGTTFDNRANMPQRFFDELAKYAGTERGREELYAEILDGSGSILPRTGWQVWTKWELPRMERVVLSMDTAFKVDKKSDYTAFVAFGLFREDYVTKELDRWGERKKKSRWSIMLLDAWKDRIAFPDLRVNAMKEYRKWCAMFDGEDETPPLFLVEDKGSGQSLIQEMDRSGVPVHPYNPGRDSKMMRAQVVSDLLLAGRIWVPGKRLPDRSGRDPATLIGWGEKVVEELDGFTGREPEKGVDGSGGDDFVDACAQAWAFYRDSGYLTLDTDHLDRSESSRDDDERYERTESRSKVEAPY